MTVGKVDLDFADSLTRKIYEENLRYDKKWISLDGSEKLRLISMIKEIICELQRSEDKRGLDAFNGSLVIDAINERGPNRLRRIDGMLSSIRERRFEVDLKNPDNREQLLKEYRAIFKSIDLKYSDEKEG